MLWVYSDHIRLPIQRIECVDACHWFIFLGIGEKWWSRRKYHHNDNKHRL